MAKYSLFLVIVLLQNAVYAQDSNTKKAQRQYQNYSALAAEEIEKGDFAQAEALYRKALNKNPEGDKAAYNFGNLYFENQKNKQSAIRYLESAKSSENKMVKHRNFHNLGNLMMQEKQYAKAVEAYKNALRNNPEDEETRYNLAIAKKKREKQKNEGKGKDKNKDQQKKNKKKEQDKGGEGDKDEKKKDQQNRKDGKDKKENKQKQDDAKKDPKKGDSKKQKKPSEPKPQKGKMSKQQIKNLLQAIQNKEKNTQEKLNAKKVKGAKVKTEKDW